MEAARNLTGKEQERMNRLRKWIKNMKYRHKLTILLVVTALVPMTVLALYAHSRQSTMVRSSDLEDMQSIIDQTKESIDSQTAVYSSLLNYLIRRILRRSSRKKILTIILPMRNTMKSQTLFCQYRNLIMMPLTGSSCLHGVFR